MLNISLKGSSIIRLVALLVSDNMQAKGFLWREHISNRNHKKFSSTVWYYFQDSSICLKVLIAQDKYFLDEKKKLKKKKRKMKSM